MAALDPEHARVDERSDADLLAFVQTFVEQLRYFEAADGALTESGSWLNFANQSGITAADIAAYLEDPSRFSGETARWMARPHFTLLLTFVALMRHVRDQQNQFTRRHLEYYYRDILQMAPLPAEPDRVALLLQLASRVPELLLPAGTALIAGRDSAGVDLIYRTERALLINRAEVSEQRSIAVDRRITGIPDARKDASLTAAGALDATLRIALGSPKAGDAVPKWGTMAVDTAFLKGLRPTLDFARASLYLEHHELRTMMQRVRRRQAANGEWAELNRLMGAVNPAQPRDFNGNLAARVFPIVLDFKTDGLPLVDTIDDLYNQRTDKDVRKYIDEKLAVIGYDNFTALMPIKLRIDAEWAEINRLLERAGRRQRKVPVWSLSPADPANFDANLRKTLEGKWPASWPDGSTGIDSYDARLRAYEAHLSMQVERIARLVSFAESLGTSPAAKDFDWSDIDPILADAHAEMVYAGRRAALARVRGSDDSLAGFDLVVTHVLNQGKLDPVLTWESARPELAKRLDAGQLSVLDSFRDQRTRAGAVQMFEWSDVYRVLELAQRYVESFPEPVARKSEWRNLYPYADATTCLDDPGSSTRWKTFGERPVEDDKTPPQPNLGFALRSPMLALSEGTRTITLTLGLAPDGFDRDSVLRGLGVDPSTLTPATLLSGLAGALILEVSTAKGWIELPISTAKIATGKVSDDYWSICGLTRDVEEDRPAIQLQLVADPSRDAIAPLKDEALPTLRVLLRPRWEKAGKQWITALGALESLKLAGVVIEVSVDGLTQLRVQQDDRTIDPRKPFEPFGSRPAVGSRLYVSHPELVQNRLKLLRFDITWMGLPKSLPNQYKNYEGRSTNDSFKANIALLDRNLSLPLADQALFQNATGTDTSPARSLQVDSVRGKIGDLNTGFAYVRRTDLRVGADVRADSRFLLLTLTPTDFGHADYPALAAKKGREQAWALSKGQITDAAATDAYRVDAPYTPTIQSLRAAYSALEELNPAAPNDIDLLRHIHPFGEANINAEDPSLFPRYDQAGELYIGVADLAPPQRLSLLLQLAEGTSDPEVEPAEVEWSVLDGDAWRPLLVLHDTTRGLINSGLVELELPVVAPGAQLPAGLTWLRVSIPRDPNSVCDTVAIRAQAVFARFEDRGNAPEHYDAPLPVGSLTRLVEPDARISAIEQPFTSFGGKAAEPPARFYTRASERLRHKGRALCPWDYERLVLQQFAQIYKVKCLPVLEDGGVEVIVIPDIRDALPSDALSPKAPANLLADITEFLSERAPSAAGVRVRNARYVPVRVRTVVRFMADQDEDYASQRLNADLVRFLSPWAFDDGEELMIGGSVYAASIVDFIDRRPYVDYVAQITLFRGDGDNDYAMIPPSNTDYCVATRHPDEVLVAAREHDIEVISELGYEQTSFAGINFMKIELDFIVGA